MKPKWYDILTLGLTWAIRAIKVGVSIWSIYKDADVNKDGKVSYAEFKQLLQNRDYWKDKFNEINKHLTL
ncbi:hypothetical protein [Metamycoplasma buccale]|uniref:hypothetical protein n=1 Tax=Metamycoplasma buccale TaxID=55602 RepID=UPI00398E91DF